MTKKDDGSQATLVEKLSRPVSWQSFVDVMTHEIRFGSTDKSRRDFADLDGEAEKLLSEARREAQRTGVPIEQVLGNMGMLPKDHLSVGPGGVNRRQLLNQLGWESLSGEFRAVSSAEHQAAATLTGDASAPSPEPIQLLDEVACLRRLQNALPSITLDELSIFLERLSAQDTQLRDQLIVCEVITREHLEDARVTTDENTPFWLLLLSCGANPERLASLIVSLPWYPIIHEEKGDLVDYLADEGVLSFRQFKSYMEQRKEGDLSTQELIGSFLDSPDHLTGAIAELFSLPISSPEQFPVVSDALPSELLPVLRVFALVPLSLEEPHAFGGTRPITELQRKMLEQVVGHFEYYLLAPSDYERRRQQIQGQLASSRHADARQKARDIGAILDVITNTSAVRLVENMFEKALEAKATDIHLEHQEDSFRVRYRVDSILQEAMSVHPELSDEVISRIKILAGMDITERRQPQDGHIKVSIGGRDVNMRVATVPTYRGERIGIRLLNSGQVQLSLEELGLEQRDLERMDRLASRPYGMILTTGPVGSGKTTTLYSSLTRLNHSEQNIITIEDPVEYEIDGINQIEVNYRINFGFAQGLRAILRQDPNVILVGEIRDHETAAIAIRASMTGLLVFSSLHTNDAAGAVTTFHNFQVAPLLIANSMLGVVAQRLVRRLCPSCRELSPPTLQESEIFENAQQDPPDALAHPVGCQECYFTGYSGRVGIFELMEVTPSIREMIMEKAPERKIREEALRNGMTLLSDAALEKVRKQVTSLEDVRRVVHL